ncbi:MAG: NTP transferase domain-containing protein [Bacteroidia bacterium]
MKDDLDAIILAAGNSQRMGSCKFFLLMDSGLTFFENIIIQLSNFGIENIIVVTQKTHLKELKRLSKKHKISPIFITNDFPERGRFYSVQLGIKHTIQSEFSFIHNADSPFIETSVLEKLYDSREKAEVVYPIFNKKGGHPVLVNNKVKQGLIKMPVNSVLKESLKEFKRISVDVDNELITADIDTTEDYEKYILKK